MNIEFEETSQWDSLVFMYGSLAIKNIDFALISLSFLLDHKKIDFELYKDEHTYYFLHIQSVLCACGILWNIFCNHRSKILPQNNFDSNIGERGITRAKYLRDFFRISVSAYPLVFNKEVRNTNEHFDERLQTLLKRNNKIGDYIILDETIPLKIRKELFGKTYLRTFDKEKRVYSTYETSKRPLPISLLIKLADYYGTSTDYILGRTNNISSSKK